MNEYCQRHRLPTPIYKEVTEALDEQEFIVSCRVDKTVVFSQLFYNKKAAEHDAAEKCLLQLQEPTPNPSQPATQESEPPAEATSSEMSLYRPNIISDHPIYDSNDERIYYVVDLDTWDEPLPRIVQRVFYNSASYLEHFRDEIPKEVCCPLYPDTPNAMAMTVMIYCTRFVALMRPAETLVILGKNPLYSEFVDALRDPRVQLA